jgi:hypothetical protein
MIGGTNMNIEITEKYKASLIPFPKETLEPLNRDVQADFEEAEGS